MGHVSSTPLHAKNAVGLISCRSSAGNHSCCEFVSTEGCHIRGTPFHIHWSSPNTGSYGLPAMSSVMIPHSGMMAHWHLQEAHGSIVTLCINCHPMLRETNLMRMNAGRLSKNINVGGSQRKGWEVNCQELLNFSWCPKVWTWKVKSEDDINGEEIIMGRGCNRRGDRWIDSRRMCVLLRGLRSVLD